MTTSKTTKKTDWGVSRFNIILAIIISLIGLFQFVQGISNTYAKTTVVANLEIEVRVHFLEQDERYYQNKIWALEDRFGHENLVNHNPNVPPVIMSRYREYRIILLKIKDELKYLKSRYYNKHGFGSKIYRK